MRGKQRKPRGIIWLVLVIMCLAFPLGVSAQGENMKGYINGQLKQNEEFLVGEDIVLRAEVSPDAGDGNCTYQWFLDEEEVPGETDTFSMKKGRGPETVHCIAFDGNKNQIGDLYFDLLVKKTLSWRKKLTQIDGTRTDFTKEDEYYRFIVTASSTHSSDISYQWFKLVDDTEQELVGETAPQILVQKNGKAEETYYCLVDDGNQQERVECLLPAVLEDAVSLKTTGFMNCDKETDWDGFVQGDTVRMRVRVDASSVDDPRRYTYKWVDGGSSYGSIDPDEIEECENGTEYSFIMGKEDRYIWCEIDDGQEKSVQQFWVLPQADYACKVYINGNEAYESEGVHYINVNQGQEAELEIRIRHSHASTGTISYQWKKIDGTTGQETPLDETGKTLSVTRGDKDDVYVCTVSDGNTEMEKAFRFSPLGEPAIMINAYVNGEHGSGSPGSGFGTSESVEPGRTELEVEVVNGTSPSYRYEWMKTNDFWEDPVQIPDAEDPVYAFDLKHSCIYICNVISEDGQVNPVYFDLHMRVLPKVYINGKKGNYFSNTVYSDGDEKLEFFVDTGSAVECTFSWQRTIRAGEESETQTLEGEAGNTLTVTDAKPGDTYICNYQIEGDVFPNSCSFYIEAKKLEGISYWINDEYYEPGPGYESGGSYKQKKADPVTIEVCGKKDPASYSYTWYRREFVDESWKEEEISDSHTNILEITPQQYREYYSVVVSDGEKSVKESFTLVTDELTNSQASVEMYVNGTDPEYDEHGIRHWQVEKGKPATLKVTYPNETQDTYYDWFIGGVRMVEDSEGNDVHNKNEYVIVPEEEQVDVLCKIINFGGTTEYAFFHLRTPHESEIKAETWINGEPCSTDEESPYIYDPEKDLTLEVKVKEGQDATGLAYKWSYVKDDYVIDARGGNEAAYTPKKPYSNTYYCAVRDKKSGRFLESYAFWLIDGQEVVSGEKIVIKYQTLQLAVGEKKQLKAFVQPKNASVQKISYSSSDGNVVSVDSEGWITAIADGEAVITASTAEGIKAQCTVTAGKGPAEPEPENPSPETPSAGDTGKDTKQPTQPTTAPKSQETTAPASSPAAGLSDGDPGNALSLAGTEKGILALKGKKEMKKAAYLPIQFRLLKSTKNSNTLSWKKVKGASGYRIYGSLYGKKLKKLADLGRTKKSFKHKKLKKGKYYKYILVAYKTKNKTRTTVAVSKAVYGATAGTKAGNVKKIRLNRSSVKIKKGKAFKIKAKEISNNVKVKRFRKLQYMSSDKKIATVTSTGRIRGRKKGSCYIYVFAQNGLSKRIKVRVR